MSLRELPARPNLEHLRNQAKTLLSQALASDPEAQARFSNTSMTSREPKLADALHVIAQEYGFSSWPELKLQVQVASDDPFTALGRAIQADNAALLNDLLARFPTLASQLDQPLPQSDFGAQPLIVAVNHGNRAIIDALLQAGANVNVRSQWWAGGFGVLDSADPELADYLIARGAVVDIHAACRLGRKDRVRELLSADPSCVQMRGGDGQLPLHFAADVETAALLLDAGADIDARDIDHESTAAQYMAASRQEVVRYLLSRGAQPDIIMASAVGDLSLVESILNHDPDSVRITVSERHFPKQNPRSGGVIYLFTFGVTRSPHAIAHQFGHSAVFQLLMQRSAPWLRLAQAAEVNDHALVNRILTAHPKLIAKVTPGAARRLVSAAVRNNTESVRLLLEAGWPVAAALENGQTALHYAAWHGNATMVATLLQHQAPVNVAETEHGGSPLGWALHGSLHGWHRESGDYPSVVRSLLAAGAAIPRPEGPLEATEEVLALLRERQN